MNEKELLTVGNLNVSYGESKVLFDIEMGVKPGQVVACVGRNGAGKSTLLKSIAGFIKNISGTVTCDGASLLGINGNVIISHGRSKAKAIKNAIGLAKRTAEQDLVNVIKNGKL